MASSALGRAERARYRRQSSGLSPRPGTIPAHWKDSLVSGHAVRQTLLISSGTRVQALAPKAKQRRLVIYAGAGLSMASPSDLRSGLRLAHDLDRWLTHRPVSELPSCDATNIFDIADAVESTVGPGLSVRP